MEMEEVKKLVKVELVKLNAFWETSESQHGSMGHFRFFNDDLEVSLQEFYSEWSQEVNVFLGFELNGLDYDITSFNANQKSIEKLFAEYKRIKEE